MRYAVMVGLARTLSVVEWTSLVVGRAVPVVKLAALVVVPL